MKTLSAFLLLILLAFSAYSQKSPGHPTARLKPGHPVTLTWEQVVHTVHFADSLKQVNHTLRLQARQSALATEAYRRTADSLYQAVRVQQSETLHLREVIAQTNVLLVSQQAKTAKFKARAHRKGWVLGVLAAVGAGLIYGAAH